MEAAAAPRARVGLPRRALRLAADERLVAGVRSGSRAAFEALYDRHHRGILAFCRHMLGSREEAEDAVQHTFAAAYTSLTTDDRDIALKAWLYAIARNRCLSVLRARREQVGLDELQAAQPSTAGLAAEVERREDLRLLLGDLQRLPEDQRAALVLAELGAHSHGEIAEVLDVRPAKVKALVFQAREALMNQRRAREADCGEIREQLAVLRGGALRRSELRRHVDTCEGCRAFEAEVRRQRAGMAVLLPVAPTLALKHSSLAAAFAAVAGTGAAATGGSAVLAAGGAVVGVKSIAAKALVALAVTGGAGGGGYAAVDELRSDPDPRPPARAQPASAKAAPSAPRQALSRPLATPLAAPAATQTGTGTERDDRAQRDRREHDRDRDARPGRSERRDGLAPGQEGARGRRSDRAARGLAERRRRAAQRARERTGATGGTRRTPARRRARRRPQRTPSVPAPARRREPPVRTPIRPPRNPAPVPQAPATTTAPETVVPEAPIRTTPEPGTGG